MQNLKCSTKETISKCSSWDRQCTFAICTSFRPAFNSELASRRAENHRWGQSRALLLFIPAKMRLVNLAGSCWQWARCSCAWTNTPNKYTCIIFSLFPRNHETVWCLVLLCATVLLLLFTFAASSLKPILSPYEHSCCLLPIRGFLVQASTTSDDSLSLTAAGARSSLRLRCVSAQLSLFFTSNQQGQQIWDGIIAFSL